ncbi:hypothetical protein F2Q68_00034273 [Brassica cretica]|uniref:Uncharacterized protein n=1 Tax=Brassica cretica TaxID=69181 RepID=A0A8S9H009_BRACR|nr:hypothetical protein F2Q68_00034273 [Brassica cretica]
MPLNDSRCTCPAVPEATRKLTCYSHQILEVRIVESAKKNAPHRSTTTLVHRSILVNHRRPRHYSSRPILAHHRRPKTPMSRRPTSIDTSVRTSIDTEPRDMVATLILVRDERGDLYDEEGHLRKATGTCPAVPEATRKLTCYSHQILEVRIVQSAKKNAPHRSTTTLVHRSILVNHRRPRH